MLNKKTLIWVGLVLLALNTFAQKVNNNNNTTSPYSRYGIGELQSTSLGRSSAMGGAAIASRNRTQLNLSNPASYTAIDTMSFIFEGAISAKQSTFKDASTSQKNNNANFQYFALNFPVTKWSAAAFGVQPYSDSGYDIIQTFETSNGFDAETNYYGNGGITKAFLGLAVMPVKNLSVGANFNYLFGSFTKNTSTFFPVTNSYVKYNYDSVRVRNFSVNFGIQYLMELNKNNKLTLGATYELERTFDADVKSAEYKTVSFDSNTAPLTEIIKARTKEELPMTLPMSFGIGVSYQYKDKVTANFDYVRQSWSNGELDFGEGRDYDNNLTDLTKYAFGLEFVPDQYSIKGYHNRVAYRIGAFYNDGYLNVNNENLSHYGVTMGFGLPLANPSKLMHNSVINLSVELGKMGNVNNGLVQENYVKFNVGFSLYDNWFIKRKFD